MRVTTAFLCVFLFATLSMSAFEGKLSMQMNIAEKGKSKTAQRIDFYLKDVRGLVEINDEKGNQQGSMIWNTEKDEIITLFSQNGQKMALKSTITLWKTLATTMSGTFSEIAVANADDEFTWVKTNETRTIDGVRARKYNGENSEYTMEAWVAENQEMPSNALAPFMQMFPALESMHGFGSGLIKESTVKAKDGSSVVNLTNKLQNTSVDDARFTVPSGYAVMDISRMLQQMQELDEETSKRFLEQMIQGGRR